MALIKTFTDPCGNSYTASYWFATTIRTDSVGEAIEATFSGWKDQASFDAGLQPMPGGSKYYRATGTDFLAIAEAAPVGSTLYAVLAQAAEGYALGKLDTPNGTTDTSGKPVMVSFFDGATQE